MGVKGIRDTEKVAVGAIRAAIQTWLAPQLSGISERLAHVEGRLDGMDRRFELLRKRSKACATKWEACVGTCAPKFPLFTSKFAGSIPYPTCVKTGLTRGEIRPADLAPIRK